MKRLPLYLVLGLALALLAGCGGHSAKPAPPPSFGSTFGPGRPAVSGGYDCYKPTDTEIAPFRYQLSAWGVLANDPTHCPYAAKQITIVTQLYRQHGSTALWDRVAQSSNTFQKPCIGCTVSQGAFYTCKNLNSFKMYASYITLIVFRKDGTVGTYTAWSSDKRILCA